MKLQPIPRDLVPPTDAEIAIVSATVAKLVADILADGRERAARRKAPFPPRPRHCWLTREQLTEAYRRAATQGPQRA